MSKPHRGSSLRELFKRGRGECPVCKRKNVKVLYEQETDGQKFKICKTCKAAIKNGKKALPVVARKEEPVKAVQEAPKVKEAEKVEEAAVETQDATAETVQEAASAE
ncbi:MAG: hypothetical protein LBI04_08960 [Treponema sp.]|jgi:uncharacterized Zn finger protein (UPF0148 family)|nr:hypothetical protein [Treponema sp.]